jgi:S-methyl-5-thioribose-1-phosphate isomerase
MVWIIDQTRLPFQFAIVPMRTWQETADAIVHMRVRGAGAIGATAAAGVAQAAIHARDSYFWEDVLAAVEGIRHTRPTAQNLFYGVNRVLTALETERASPARAREAGIAAAQAVADEDALACEQIGLHGRPLLWDGMSVSTHCNAGWLAFVDWGSALSPIYRAHRDGLKVHVWVDETRPRGQGARLTAWELAQEGVPHTVIADSMIGSLMRKGEVHLVIVGADRIAANGDVANKIGTYGLAVLAQAHGIPFYVAAPTSTIDGGCLDGQAIPIEERSGDELAWVPGLAEDGSSTRVRVTPDGAVCGNPAFDVTPAKLISGIVTEKGIFPSKEVLRAVSEWAGESSRA